MGDTDTDAQYLRGSKLKVHEGPVGPVLDKV